LRNAEQQQASPRIELRILELADFFEIMIS